jgi:hypothetical protein
MRASRAEITIEEILTEAGLNFEMEYVIEGLNSSNGKALRFDFAVFGDDGELDFLIEYQGRQHYEPSQKFGGKRGFYQQQFNDNKKRRYCALNGITLIEIPYTDED